MLREHEKLARQCASKGVDHVRTLARLIELELLDREARMLDRRIEAAFAVAHRARSDGAAMGNSRTHGDSMAHSRP